MAGVNDRTLGRIHQLHSLELSLVCHVAGEVGNRILITLLRGASRIGDWPLSVAVGLILLATHGLRIMVLWTAAGVGAVALQTLAKRTVCRIRPCEHPEGPPQRAPIPDKGSFPSGHTLHAVMGLVVVAQLVPVLTSIIAPLALLIGVSRVVLGVHYPTDVAAGACLGGLFGTIMLMLV
jgi:undecaprenyl-diphosphatase